MEAFIEDDDDEPVIERYLAIKRHEEVRLADIVTGVRPDGSYDLNLKYLLLAAVDTKDRPYLVDVFGNLSRVEQLYFEEDQIWLEADSFSKLLHKLDRKIQKRLVWLDTSTYPGKICVGIR